MNDLSSVFEQTIDTAVASGADDVEVSYAGTETHFVRFASSRFTQVGATQRDAIRVRVLVDGRVASMMAASPTATVLGETARQAVEVARLSPALDVAFSFSAPDNPSANNVDVDGISADQPEPPALEPGLSATGAPAALAAAFAPHRARGVLFAGAVKSHRQRFAVFTRRGCRRRFANTVTDAQLIGLADHSSGFANRFGRGDLPIDLAQIAGEAAERALRGRDPVTIEPGAYDVILAPAALAEIVEWMAMVSFGANGLLEGTSFLAGRRGQELCDPGITIRDQPLPDDPGFDAEGSSRETVTFIDKGVGGRVVTDRVTAARLDDDRGSTGHAPLIVDEFATGPAPLSIRVEPGSASEAELLRRVSRGIYVTRLHYVNGLLNPHKATTTGMTRDGTFMIRDGELCEGLGNLRFTEHILEAFSRVGGIGSQLSCLPTWWSDGGSITCPAILLRDFRFTGASR